MVAGHRWIGYLRGLAGAAVGAAVGYFLFGLMWRQGFYALALPPALLGLGCSFASRISSNLLGAVCAVAGVALAVFMEWHWRPFRVDDSLGYFLTHLHNLQGMTLFMISLSGIFGFWFGRGRGNQADAEE
jgi:hypothetical protein